jgi:hypothetical protein
VVINYNSIQVSYFLTGAVQVGWNGGVQASTSTGLIFGNLKPDNSGYSGTFYNASGSGELLGGFGSFGNGVQVLGATVGGNLTATPTGGAGPSTTSAPMNAGNILTNPATSSFDLIQFAIHALVCSQ